MIKQEAEQNGIRTLRTLRSLTRRCTSTFASLNGVPTPAASLKCSIWDVTFQRGDGVFEAVRVIADRDGVPAPRAVGLHLDPIRALGEPLWSCRCRRAANWKRGCEMPRATAARAATCV